MLPFLVAAPVAAQPVVVRLGGHDGFGRIVFEFAQSQAFTTERTGNALVLHFPGGGDVPDADGSVRNVAAVTGGGGMATATIAPGARLRIVRMGTRVVVDVLDPAPLRPTSPRASPQRANVQPGAKRVTAQQEPQRPIQPPPLIDAHESKPPGPVSSPTLAQQPQAVSPPEQRVLEAPQPPTAAPSEPIELAAARAAAPAGGKGGAAILPFGASVAAAAFRHGEEAWVVFDERHPLEVSELADDPVFAGAKVELLPSATVLRFRVPQNRSVGLERRAEGWSVASAEGSVSGAVMLPVNKPNRMLFPVATPGQVVTVADAETGRNLLVGTMKVTGPGVPVALRVPEFAVLPSWLGVVIEPVSDRTSMRAVTEGFAVETGGVMSPVAEAGTALADAAVLTRRFDFQPEPVATLLRRLQSQVQEEGQAAPQARLAPRKAAAQTMIALGLGAEAQSLLRLAVTEDPRSAADADLNGLSAIAALLSSRPQEAGGLDAPGLAGSDEVTLWRAVRTAMTEEHSAQAAQGFAATVGLILSYPSALRSRLLPVAAETMAEGGAAKAADALLASLPDEPSLALARAIRFEQKGDTASALKLYDALATGRDRLASARATTRGTLLRLNSGLMGAAEAAEALERGFDTWRGDSRERDLRLRTAEIETKAGHWRKAFKLLTSTARLFPDDEGAIAGRAAAMMSDLLHGPGASAIAPLDLVSLAEENAELIAKSDAADMELLLADKLIALDLPQRATPVIEHLASASPPGADRAALGLRLGRLRLAEGDLAGAAAALAMTEGPNLPQPLQEERDLLDAFVRGQQHDIAGASAILSRTGTQAAGELRAKILADSGDWHGAAIALGDVVSRTLPDDGPLNQDQQDLLLRLASAQSRASDEAALHAVGAKQAGRMSGARGDIFRLLTAPSVSAVGDLRRGGGEIALAKALPTSLTAIGAQ